MPPWRPVGSGWLGSFTEEYPASLAMEVEGIPVRVLPLRRILASKQAAGRPKDLAQIPALEEAIAAIEGSDDIPG